MAKLNSPFNLADLFELAVDHFGQREYLVADGRRCTYAEMEARANRLAHCLQEAGIREGDHVGIYAYNCLEWVETMWAVFKLRAVWININYRYVEKELRYLFENADLKALVYHRQFAERVRNIRRAVPKLGFLLYMEDGSGVPLEEGDGAEYEAAIDACSPQRDFPPRSGDDLYILYTGGTTGMPKGVVWRHEDVFFALGGGIDAISGTRVQEPMDIIRQGQQEQEPLTFLATAPLMHGACQWVVMGGAFVGRRTVLMVKFEPAETWRLVEQEKVNSIMVTGDAMARPLIEVLEEVPEKYDTSSLFVLTSTAALFSPVVKDRFFEHFPNLMLLDGVGASESGSNGMAVVQAGNTSMKGGPTIKPGPDTLVLGDDLKPVPMGSGLTGRLARTGNIPLGYYKDPEKTAATFVTGADGRRYAIPGDAAIAEKDGSITILGRGSMCINSGGMKIFPEEVETMLKSHDDVFDAVVVGVPDERWGEQVSAVVEPRPGRHPELEEIQDHCRGNIAAFKIPRRLFLVEKVVRSPSGKTDYRWAKKIALDSMA